MDITEHRKLRTALNQWLFYQGTKRTDFIIWLRKRLRRPEMFTEEERARIDREMAQKP